MLINVRERLEPRERMVAPRLSRLERLGIFDDLLHCLSAKAYVLSAGINFQSIVALVYVAERL